MAGEERGGGDARSTELVRVWAERLDRLDYYQLLRVAPFDAQGKPLTPEALRQAFAAFAAAFHPDRWRDYDDATKEAATRIFRRGNEALRVLQNPTLRGKYDRERKNGVLRLGADEIARESSSKMPAVKANVPPALLSVESLVASSAALPFAKEADRLLARGDKRQALLQVQLALGKEPHNRELAERARELTEAAKKDH